MIKISICMWSVSRSVRIFPMNVPVDLGNGEKSSKKKQSHNSRLKVMKNNVLLGLLY